MSGHSLRLSSSWDVKILLGIAQRLHEGTQLTSYEQGYVARYPNNAAMIAIDRAAYALSGASGWPAEAIIVTAAAMGSAVVVWAVHGMVLPLAGQVAAVGAQTATAGLYAASPWVSIPYTDVMAAPFLCGGLFLVLAAMRRSDRWALALAVAGGAGIAAAAVIKTIPYVVVVAVLVTGTLTVLGVRRDRRAVRRWVVGTLAASAAFAGMALATTAASASVLSEVPRVAQTSAPTLWWLANGMTRTERPGSPPSYGGFSSSMLHAIAGKTDKEASAWAADWIHGLWARRGLTGTAAFYGGKTAWIWGDGMFWAWGRARTPSRSGSAPVPGWLPSCVTSTGRTGGGTQYAATSPRRCGSPYSLLRDSERYSPCARGPGCSSSRCPSSGSRCSPCCSKVVHATCSRSSRSSSPSPPWCTPPSPARAQRS